VLFFFLAPSALLQSFQKPNFVRRMEREGGRGGGVREGGRPGRWRGEGGRITRRDGSGGQVEQRMEGRGAESQKSGQWMVEGGGRMEGQRAGQRGQKKKSPG
jgi:hypothetical protein